MDNVNVVVVKRKKVNICKSDIDHAWGLDRVGAKSRQNLMMIRYSSVAMKHWPRPFPP